MDVLAEILPPSYLVKSSENTAKDRRQTPNKQAKFADKKKREDESTEVANSEDDQWDLSERRSGEDRRELRQNRGRWLESRSKKDRRKANIKPAIAFKI